MHVDGAAPLRLAPHAVVLRRSRTELQVGVDPSLVVPETYTDLLGALSALGAGADRRRLDVVARRGRLPQDAVQDLLVGLARRQLLETVSAAGKRAVRVVGAGPLARRTADALSEAGFTDFYHSDLPGHRVAGESAARPGGRGEARPPDRLDLLVAAVATSRPGVRSRRTPHFLKPEGDAVALTVVVADGPEPDRLVPDLLREHGAAHLLVRCSGDEAVVGPLVVPWVTSCVRCADLARRDADPPWPWLLEQLTRLSVDPAPTLTSWAAVTAAVQALAFVDGGEPETLGRTLELGLAPYASRARSWRVHPECPCRWDEPWAGPEEREGDVGAGEKNGRHA